MALGSGRLRGLYRRRRGFARPVSLRRDTELPPPRRPQPPEAMRPARSPAPSTRWCRLALQMFACACLLQGGRGEDYTTAEGGSGAGSGTELYGDPTGGGEPDTASRALLRQLAQQTGLELSNQSARTGESLSHEGSEQSSVVFVADGSGYAPVTRSRPFTRPDWQLPVETWDRDYRRKRHNTTRVQHIEAECQDDYMKIRIGFNGSFAGLLYSAGYAYDPDCVYINGTGRDYYEFYIQLNRCGTLGKNTHQEDSKKNPTKNFMWNTVTVQYNPLIEEEWDEHFKVTCEYGYDFWKTVTFPFLDVEVATGNPVVFTLSPPECYMEIRNGYGTSGTRVTGPVRVGDPLTLIIYMRSKYDGFDIVVNDCYAHNGATKRIQLIDQYGCPVDDKLISRFRGSWSESGVFETQVFAYMKTFRFTGSPALYIECDVRMCHGRCPSQPCHWRNAKGVSKRSAEESTAPPRLQSENVSLFQSLRVLQDGETDGEAAALNSTLADPNSICMRIGAFTSLLGVGCVALCLLGAALGVLCCRLRRLKCQDDVVAMAKETASMAGSAFGHAAFMTHKGRIN